MHLDLTQKLKCPMKKHHRREAGVQLCPVVEGIDKVTLVDAWNPDSIKLLHFEKEAQMYPVL